MATIGIKIEQEDEKILKYATDKGWQEKIIETGKDSKGLETRTEIINPETYQEFVKRQIEDLLVENFSFFSAREIQEQSRQQLEKQIQSLHDETKSTISVEIN